MALVIHDCCFHARPKSSQSQPSNMFSGKSLAPVTFFYVIEPGKLASPHYRVERFPFFGDISTRSCGNRSMLPSREGIHETLNGLCKFEGSCIINQMLPVGEKKLKWIFHDEVKLLSRSKMMGLLVINAFTLATPFEALAEKCEAENSVFNMPLLLFVALIGATVGGGICISTSGASLQRQGKYREAIKYHSIVLGMSEREGEDSGNTEAYGAIADCYTEIGDLERAGKFYDEYIARLETD
ncbi:protein FLUORESCENT IN BLUE LIGHT, chloroplastic-like [Tripterygium wilfordii]|uniref:protein FLUORESCENT IN BLUE LIGHT, chloroplastic-like n=1 Tax=Tripterygium wilfordii TaxID=458696 RepID=UPI0018F85D8F|nr:protein FLUORESCENT IN BLUE LIGHT, chloroplastic-like [Tripterygium wilfordii]